MRTFKTCHMQFVVDEMELFMECLNCVENCMCRRDKMEIVQIKENEEEKEKNDDSDI